MIPSFVDKQLHIEMPTTLEIIIILFIFSAEILGEIQEYYLIFDHWDAMLHTINGFLMAAIGFSLIDILNQNENFSMSLSPVFVAVFAFCFSMTIGVLWEFFEFGADWFFQTDMQKDTTVSYTHLDVYKRQEEAHKMTKEIIEENEEKDIDYQAQFGLCITYLLETEDGKQITVKIKGDATDEEKAQINEVAKAFADYYCDDVCTVEFQIWRRNGLSLIHILWKISIRSSPTT